MNSNPLPVVVYGLIWKLIENIRENYEK